MASRSRRTSRDPKQIAGPRVAVPLRIACTETSGPFRPLERGRIMLKRGLSAVLVTLAMAGGASPLLLAQDGTIKVRIKEAVAFKKDNDDIFNPPQDFYAIN